MARIVLASWLALFFFAVPSFAADTATEVASAQPATVRATVAAPFAAAISAAPAAELAVAPVIGPNDWYRNSTRRPSLLPALYAGSVALQAFDAYSTLSALKAGAVEANPVMKGAVSNPALFIGIKGAVTMTSIMAAERMWKNHNRTGAIITMAVSNGMMALVAQHNASVLSSLR